MQSGRRVKLLALIAIVIVCLALTLLLILNSSDPNGPKFTKIKTPLAIQPISQISYHFLDQRPFEAGKMWVTTLSGGTNRQFLFDIETGKVVGQLTNGWPVTMIGEQQVLCSRLAPGGQPQTGIRTMILSWIERISLGRIKFSPPRESETYWLLNLEKNQATKIGDIPNTPNFSFVPSPDYRYGYKAVHNQKGGVDYFCFDLDHKSIQKLNRPEWSSGWWDNTHILLQTTNFDFLLYDVKTRLVTPFIAFDRIKGLLQGKIISEDPIKAGAFCIWHGKENDFYITDGHQRWLAEESYLIKVERPDGRLNLLSPKFKFEWSDHFEPAGRYYLYSGRQSGIGSDGVFVRDLLSNTNRVLVEPNSNKYFSIPVFYRDSVIYVRSNMLWRINLDGSSNVTLFPPSAN